MDNIKFEDDEFIVPGDFYQNKVSAMIKLVLKVGLAQDESQANFVLLLTAIVFVVITVALSYFFLFTPSPEQVPYESLSEIDKLRLPEAFRNTYENK